MAKFYGRRYYRRRSYRRRSYRRRYYRRYRSFRGRRFGRCPNGSVRIGRSCRIAPPGTAKVLRQIYPRWSKKKACCESCKNGSACSSKKGSSSTAETHGKSKSDVASGLKEAVNMEQHPEKIFTKHNLKRSFHDAMMVEHEMSDL